MGTRGTDEFVYIFEALIVKAEEIQISKRNILKISSSFFDPLGLITPMVIQAKLIFQLMCREQLDWDAVVPENISKY